MPKAEGKAASAAEDDALKADVKAQLAQLGFGSGGGFSDAAFDDFAPQKANKRIGKKQAGGQQQQQDGKGRAVAKRQDDAATPGGKRQDAPPTGRQQQSGGRQQQQQEGGRQQQQQTGGRQQEQQQERRGGGPQQPQRRSWQEQQGGDEATATPKIPNAKSILPRDEPTIWHEAVSTLPALPPAKAEAAPEVVQQKRKQAERLLLVEEQNSGYAASKKGPPLLRHAFEQNMGRRSGADAKWLQQVRHGGTTSDRVAAMSVLVQDGAAANLASLDGLLAMCGKRGGARAVVTSAMDALKELFTTVLLPDRKLRFFEQQPLAKVEAGRDGERRLLYWLVGYLLTRLLAEHPGMNVPVVREIERFMFRPGLQDRARYYAVVYLNQMVLSHKQQQQQQQQQQPGQGQGGSLAKRLIDVYFTVFRMILDGKIGTAAQASCGGAGSLTNGSSCAPDGSAGRGWQCQRRSRQRLSARRSMPRFRRLTAPRRAALAKQAQDKAATEAAKKKKGEAAKARAAEKARAAAEAAATVDQSGEMDGRMLAALITGVRRAFPYVPADEVEPLIEAHADALFRLVHARSLGVATQALLLLFQLMSSRSTVSDRFYRALYAVLSSPELYRSTKAPMLLSLLFKALKADVSSRRSAAFAKRLLQVAQESPPHFACGCLLLTSELLKARPGLLPRCACGELEGCACLMPWQRWRAADARPSLWGAVLQAEEGEGDGVEHFRDAPEKAAGAPAAAKQGAAGKRRGGGGAVRAGGASPDAEEAEEAGQEEEEGDSEEEAELAAGSSEEEEEEEEAGDSDADLMPGALPALSVLPPHQQQQERQRQRQRDQQAAAAAARWPTSKDAYDMNKREPLYCNADRSCLWELTSLAAHVHPSVAAMARTLLAGQSVVYSGDPLRDLTLAAFLEKFVQKKAKAGAKGDSAMQPLAAQQAAAAAAVPHQWASLAGAHTQALQLLADKDVRPDDMFFHKYYSLQAVQDKAAKKRKKKGGDDELLSDAGSEDSDAADEFLAEEEEGGDDGIGANPDRSGMDNDYADLAAAMDSDSGGSSGEEEQGGSGSGSDGEDEGEEPAGATFSDMSGSKGEEEEAEEAEEEEEGGSSDGEFEALLAAKDLSDGEDGSGSGSSSSEGDEAAEDAEVAALMRHHGITPLPPGASAASDEEEEALNPFELAEATSSEAGGSSGEDGGSSSEDDGEADSEEEEEEAAAVAGGGTRKRGKSDGLSVFASADDYATMIEEDIAEGAGLDDGTEEGGGHGGSGGSGGGSGGRGGRGHKRPRGGRDGGGRGAPPPKRQQQGRGRGRGRGGGTRGGRR
ncbi:hypothetical protein CHLNCDRAFT_52919 [Chlorella variabilis]|uniref:CCAAT-binding factor domain-containing protein n=1 Tax=Chlorella variabilis TaxID=554065 RepID=E1ZHJ5_CHLVA|nr:hypothetical protein CHLNCDRAFT_52919 [Chlorella variabilis]EFN54473.1 hypothetical protein CHLNCDRAFT_52919 [Chlorella variabilis]|eukprot:XP_005846575.1 hypothetical protein CHLNCDRAFT_52919 [Chlorella variabilis]